MPLKISQLDSQLKQPLKAVYLVSGDEPLQLGEAADAIRAQARSQEFSDRTVLEHSKTFDWNQLLAEADNLSLFAERRIIELRLSSSKIGAEGSKALAAYLDRPPEDTLLLITSPKLERAQQNSKWVKAITGQGVWVAVWPVDGRQLIDWIGQRLQSKGIRPTPEINAMLAEKSEGNLLAAVQEIEKLTLLFDQGTISTEQVRSSIADSSRYDVFQLVDSALQGNTRRSLHILNGLKAEGTALPVILWALTRDIRLLTQLSFGLGRGEKLERMMAAERIWEKRQPLVRSGLKRLGLRDWQQLLSRCSQLDRTIKGRGQGDPWHLLEKILTRMTGVAPIKGRTTGTTTV